MGLLLFLDALLALVSGIILVYQVVCLIIGLFTKPLDFPDCPQDKRFAVLVSARNERTVIASLIESIRANDYPQRLIDIWVVADNCTDDTAAIASSHGAHVIERHDTANIGKGYALTYLLNRMIESGAADAYDAFFVFDADNLLDEHYFTEMNKAFQSGFDVCTSYRNSKNLQENWVSSGSALWFIRESRFLNNTRMFLGSSCNVSGTGFMFSQAIMRRNDGWKFHLMTEDVEFTLDSVLHGDRIGYCGTAVLYDEQPVSFAQSWRQRLRWSKGYLQVFRYYGLPLLHRILTEGDFTAVDFMTLVFPSTVLWVVRELLGFLFAACGFVTWQSQIDNAVAWGWGTLWGMLGMTAIAALTVIAERPRIGATNKELVAYVLSFPIYALSFVPISFCALFSKPEWKPIEHHGQVTSQAVRSASQDASPDASQACEQTSE